MIQKQHIKDTS